MTWGRWRLLGRLLVALVNAVLALYGEPPAHAKERIDDLADRLDALAAARRATS